MAVFQLKTFLDIYTAVREELQIQSADTVAMNRIKRDINIVYNEVVSESDWWWRQGHTSVQQSAYINAGTVGVTQGLATVTFSVAPMASKQGCLFAVDGFNEIYTIAAHVAGSSTAQLTQLYNGATSTGASYRVWNDRVALPVDCKDTTLVWHDNHRNALDNVGLQEFRRLAATAPRTEGMPVFYSVGDYVDPSPYTAVTGLPAVSQRTSAGVVKTIVFSAGLPSTIVSKVASGDPVRWNISNAGDPTYNGDLFVAAITTTTVANDTITFVGRAELTEPLTGDPGMTVQAVKSENDYARYREIRFFPSMTPGRVILHIDYVKDVSPLENDLDEPVMPLEDRIVVLYGALHRAWSRLRNPDEAARNLNLYSDKLGKMQGKLQNTFDKPRLAPSKMYMGAKRSIVTSRQMASSTVDGFGGGNGVQVTGLANSVATFDAKGNIAGSSTITVSELNNLDNSRTNLQTQLDAITALPTGNIYIGNGSGQISAVLPAGDVTVSTSGATLVTAGAIVDSKVSATAAIMRSKLAPGTANMVVANSGAGVMTDTGVSANELSFVSGTEPLTTLTLPDNTAVAAVAFTEASSYATVVVYYSLSRGAGNLESGTITIVNDGTNAAIAQGGIASLGTMGVTFTVDVSASNVRLKYTTTATGTAATFKYKLHKW